MVKSCIIALLIGLGLPACAENAETPAAEDQKPVAVETFKLKDGREVVGTYDAEHSQLHLVDGKTGKTVGSMFVKAESIASRAPATITPAQASAKKALPGANGEWIDNYAEAVKSAQATKRPILIDFTGSDWCGWCIRLHEEVFSTPEFKSWAAQNVVLVVADFPRKKQLPAEVKKQNEELNQKFGIEGFPTVVVVDATGKEKARSGYLDGGAKAWITDISGKIGLKR
jgi:thioredoxin-related protein